MTSKKEHTKAKNWKVITGIILIGLQSLGGWDVRELKYLFRDLETFSLVLGKTTGYNLIGIVGFILILIYIIELLRYDKSHNHQ